jgi:uncharacterized HAD superfamily protein
MKRYLLFVGGAYYPRGGWLDFHGAFDSVVDAETYVTNNPKFLECPDDEYESLIDWAHVVDTTTKRIVWRFHERFNETTRRTEKVWGI